MSEIKIQFSPERQVCPAAAEITNITDQMKIWSTERLDSITIQRNSYTLALLVSSRVFRTITAPLITQYRSDKITTPSFCNAKCLWISSIRPILVWQNVFPSSHSLDTLADRKILKSCRCCNNNNDTEKNRWWVNSRWL